MMPRVKHSALGLLVFLGACNTGGDAIPVIADGAADDVPADGSGDVTRDVPAPDAPAFDANALGADALDAGPADAPADRALIDAAVADAMTDAALDAAIGDTASDLPAADAASPPTIFLTVDELPAYLNGSRPYHQADGVPHDFH